MRVRQPGVERDQRRLETEAHQEERCGKKQSRVHLGAAEPRRYLSRSICHVERAGYGVDRPHREEDHHRSHAAEDHVLEPGLELVRLDAERDECVRCDRRDLQEHEQVEEVTRHHHTVHPGDHQHEEAVVLRQPCVHLHVLQREDDTEERYYVDGDQQKDGQAVAHERYPQGRGPPSHVVDHCRRPDGEDRHHRQHQSGEHSQRLSALLPPHTQKRDQEGRSERDRNIERYWVHWLSPQLADL